MIGGEQELIIFFFGYEVYMLKTVRVEKLVITKIEWTCYMWKPICLFGHFVGFYLVVFCILSYRWKLRLYNPEFTDCISPKIFGSSLTREEIILKKKKMVLNLVRFSGIVWVLHGFRNLISKVTNPNVLD